MPNRLSHRRPLDFQLRPDGGAEAVFDRIVTTPWGRAFLHPHCPPTDSSHASHANETTWICVSNIPFHAKICDKPTRIARVMQLPTFLTYYGLLTASLKKWTCDRPMYRAFSRRQA